MKLISDPAILRTSLGSSPPYQGGWPLTSVIPMEPASPTQIDPSLALALRSVTRAQLYMYVVSRLGVYQRSNHLPTGGVVGVSTFIEN